MALLVLFAWIGCVDKVDFNTGGEAQAVPLIVEGRLSSDELARVYISRAYPVDGKYHATPDTSADVWITNLESQQDYTLTLTGGSKQYGAMYQSASLIPVTVGSRYQLHVTFADGREYESEPQVVNAAGEIERIYYELVTVFNREKNVEENGINVYVDAVAPVETDWNMRWKFNGTYLLQTLCSVEFCTEPNCSETCWVSEREGRPLLARSQFLSGARAPRNFVTYIPVNIQTFYDRYHVEIVQEAISSEAWEFFHGIRYQIDNASSLFQPPFSSLKGNIRSTGTPSTVLGIFTAAQTVRKSIFINRSDLPYEVLGTLPLCDCKFWKNSTDVIPPFWF